MQLKSAKPRSVFTYLRSLFLIPAIASLLFFLWCVWSILPYFLAMMLCGLAFQLSVMGLLPLLKR
ncbi:hypothetical protein H6F44_07810 [Pseudanabaena sp. FACHB-1277]|uniref:Uncharacterized protein n=1 Tax=Pseudanabaena cinerea FACHB-1277 TaxID=2949581 RepID=A0A926UTS3_9CYAN|nr:hypothetical protein [Pseudanabaena cinerea]MBD2150027.1 hypothetical protein [Pseudanabaena cinerea FACHB-1277]